MSLKKQWDQESESSTPPSSPPVTAARRRFDDEEGDSDVIDSWDAAEDSEAESERTRTAAEAKTKSSDPAAAAASKKSKTQRIADHQAERARQRAAEDEETSETDETDAQRRERLRRTEQEADLHHAEDLFGSVGISSGRKAATIGTSVAVDPKDPSKTVNLAALPLFNPQSKSQFEQMRSILGPIIAGNSKRAHYCLFLEEFVKDLAKELSSEQVKKAASVLTRLSNEKMKEEKAADKGGKKTKAAKTKTSLVTTRPNTTDLATYDEGAFGDDDFM